MSSAQSIRNEISDYTDSVHAIIGFVNFYRFDDRERRIRDDVVVFQGRRLKPSSAKAVNAEGNAVKQITPDFGVLHPAGRHVLGDVKKSFPMDRDLWVGTFNQLMSYDDHCTGWPCPAGVVETHDVVLLTHQSRAVAVRDHFLKLQEHGEVSFTRPFVIVAFNHGANGNEYFFFKKEYGALFDADLDSRLYEGVPVMMSVFLEQYTTVKLYDTAPPTPYMAFLIWEYIITPRASDAAGKLARSNQKVQVRIAVEQVLTELTEGYGFQQLHTGNPENQPSAQVTLL